MTMPSEVANAWARASVTTTVDVSITITSGSGRVLVAFPGIYDNADGDTVSSVVFDPGGGDEANFTNEAGATGSYFNSGLSIYYRNEGWYLILPDGVSDDTYTVQVTTDGTVGRIICSVWEVADADTTDPIGASGAGTGNGTTASVDVTTTATNSLVAAGRIHKRNALGTPGADDVEVTDSASNLNSLWSGYTAAASIDTYTVSVDSGVADYWAMSGVEILESGGAPPSNAPTGNVSGPLVGPLGGPI